MRSVGSSLPGGLLENGPAPIRVQDRDIEVIGTDQTDERAVIDPSATFGSRSFIRLEPPGELLLRLDKRVAQLLLLVLVLCQRDGEQGETCMSSNRRDTILRRMTLTESST